MNQTLTMLVLLVVALPVAAPAQAGPASADDTAACSPSAGTCGVDDSGAAGRAGAPSPSSPAGPRTLEYYWGERCPHCAEARPFLEALRLEQPELQLVSVEVRTDPAGRERFLGRTRSLGLSPPSIPLFVVGERYVVGFRQGITEPAVRALLAGESTSELGVDLPLVGRVDPKALSLPLFTLLVGLVDGINPCAMWVLVVLLSILTHVRSRRRVLLYGGTFVFVSGLVYFLFMAAWIELFSLAGLSRAVTVVLGALVTVMGLINLKELFWFKRGISLVIPEAAKPSLYRRMRHIAQSAGTAAAFAGIIVLAFFVNLIELGCTLGLPAVYTRVLSLQPDLSTAGRYAYLALYNLAYIVPLALIVGAYAVAVHKLAMGERTAKALKAVSGVLLTAFGILLMAAPEWLSL